MSYRIHVEGDGVHAAQQIIEYQAKTLYIAMPAEALLVQKNQQLFNKNQSLIQNEQALYNIWFNEKQEIGTVNRCKWKLQQKADRKNPTEKKKKKVV